jgi:hypothetical protein
MRLLKIIYGYYIISLMLACLSCNGSKKQNINEVNQDNNHIEYVKDLEPLTSELIHFDKSERIIYFRFHNNADSSIGILDYPTFEFKNNSEWKRIRFKDEDKITGIMMPGEPVIFVGGDYIFKLFLNSYDMDSVSNTLRIVQPYHIHTYPTPPPNTPIDTKYLIHEFRILD